MVDAPPEQGLPADEADWLDSEKYPEIGGAYAQLPLAAITPAPTFANGVLVVEPTGAATIVIGKRAVDSAILVNNVQYDGVTGDNLKQLRVTGAAGSSQTLILDFIGGLFATGVNNQVGAIIDLGAGQTDLFRIRGTDSVDTITVGSNGIAVNTDKYKDITAAGVETLSFSLAGGNDVFTATATQYDVTGPAATSTLVFGDSGNDTIVGGPFRDYLYGGAGNDTLSGGTETVAAVDDLYGEAGTDTFDQGLANDGADLIVCGSKANAMDAAENDIVTYARRTVTGVVVLLDPSATGNDGEGTISNGVITSVEADNIRNDCETIYGTKFDDDLSADTVTAVSPTSYILFGGAGNDMLRGGLGGDTLHGEAGDDTFNEAALSNGDVFNGGAGIDLVDYSARTGSPNLVVTMDGVLANDGAPGENDDVNADVENINASTGNDTITGNVSNNVFKGGAGNDTMSGLAGNDTFNEDSTYALSGGGDIFIGGDGIDTVDYGARSVAITATMIGTVAAPSADDGASGENDSIRNDVENVIGSDTGDTFTGNALANTIDGGGTTGTADTITSCGGGGDTVINTSAVTVPADCNPLTPPNP